MYLVYYVEDSVDVTKACIEAKENLQHMTNTYKMIWDDNNFGCNILNTRYEFYYDDGYMWKEAHNHYVFNNLVFAGKHAEAADYRRKYDTVKVDKLFKESVIPSKQEVKEILK